MRRFLGLGAVLVLALVCSLGGYAAPGIAQAPHAAPPPPGPAPAGAPTPKYGGVLNVMQREDLPQGLAIHETSTIAVVWPASPCFSNLVYFDPAKPSEGPDTIIGELAEKWSWQDN